MSAFNGASIPKELGEIEEAVIDLIDSMKVKLQIALGIITGGNQQKSTTYRYSTKNGAGILAFFCSKCSISP